MDVFPGLKWPRYIERLALVAEFGLHLVDGR
jgi:hypothetical protein